MKLAPVAFFVYNRADHTKRVIESLKMNKLSGESDLIIFSDAPKNPQAEAQVNEVRKYIHTVDGFKTVRIVEREKNFGLAKSFIEGTTEVVNKYDGIIALEDDDVVAPYFLKFMNDALAYYKDDERVACISGHRVPVKTKLPNNYFLRGTDTWSYATWGRSWKHFEPDGSKLLAGLQRENLIATYKTYLGSNFLEMLQEQIDGKNDSWGIRWHASAFLRNQFTLYPGRQLVVNIGLDGSGTHCTTPFSSDFKQDELYQHPVEIEGVPVIGNANAERDIAILYNSMGRGFIKRIKNKMLSYFVRVGAV